MRYLMFLLCLIFANVANAMDCEKVPDCESLGYSTEDEPNCADNGYMFCPFNHDYKKCVQYNCAKLGFTEDDKTSWCGKIVKCKGNEKFTACKALCEVGDVYYADGTCGYAEEYDDSLGKIPVGVVFWVTDNGRHGKVINLKNLTRKSKDSAFDPANPYNGDTPLHWGYLGYDVPNLINYNESNTLEKLKEHDPDLYDGKGNTAKILAADKPKCDYDLKTDEYYRHCIPQAAQAAHDFYPPNVEPNDPIVGRGKWYLPAYGEVLDIYGYDNSQITELTGLTGRKGDNKIVINGTLAALKSKGIVSELEYLEYLYSSSEYDADYAWSMNMAAGHRSTYYKGSTPVVRVCLEF